MNKDFLSERLLQEHGRRQGMEWTKIFCLRDFFKNIEGVRRGMNKDFLAERFLQEHNIRRQERNKQRFLGWLQWQTRDCLNTYMDGWMAGSLYYILVAEVIPSFKFSWCFFLRVSFLLINKRFFYLFFEFPSENFRNFHHYSQSRLPKQIIILPRNYPKIAIQIFRALQYDRLREEFVLKARII